MTFGPGWFVPKRLLREKVPGSESLILAIKEFFQSSLETEVRSSRFHGWPGLSLDDSTY